jgi:hypothetical protein
MDTSGGVRYNGDGTITDSAGNVFDSSGDYLGPAPNDAGANDSAGPNADFDDYTPYVPYVPGQSSNADFDDYTPYVPASNNMGMDSYLAQEAALNDGMGYADVNMGFSPDDSNYWYA